MALHSEEDLFPSEELGIPAHNHLIDLCSGNVLGQKGEEIVWHTYSSSLAPSKLVEDYQHKVGKLGFEPKGEGGLWRFQKESKTSGLTPPKVSRVLEIAPIEHYEGPTCEKQAPPQAKSIVEFSTLYKR